MEEQNTQTNQIETNIIIPPIQGVDLYVPSSIEKKRALVMYFLFGIMIVIADKKTNDFEYFHFKQAIWWRVSFIAFIMLSLVILFLPIIKFIGLLLILVLFGVLIFMIKQAWDGKYYPDLKWYPLAVFPSLWNWLTSLFEINLK